MIIARPTTRMKSQNLTLNCSSEAIAIAEQKSERYSNNSAAWNAYLNCLCLQVFVPWLQDTTGENVQLWLIDSEQSHLWEFLNGTAIQLGETRLVLLPTENEEIDLPSIPQEWVDIPEFVADYYLPIYVNLEEEAHECAIEVLGYVTHQELKKNGQYHRETQTYTPTQRDFIEDLTLLFLARQLVGDRKTQVNSLPSLTFQQQQELLIKLSHSSVWEPRLALPFIEWGALINTPQGRGELYQQRLMAAESDPSAIVSLHQWFYHLRQGVQTFAEKGWQTVEEIVQELGGEQPELAYRFGNPNFRDSVSHFPQAVPGLIELLNSRPDKETELSTLHLLGQIGYGNSSAISFLDRLLYKTEDGDIRRQAAVSLGKIDPTHPKSGIRRIKIVDFGIRLDSTKIAVAMTLLPEEKNQTSVNLRVYPADKKSHLPETLQLSILDEEGNLFDRERAREADVALQLEFSGGQGDRFSLKVSLGEIEVTERFSI